MKINTALTASKNKQKTLNVNSLANHRNIIHQKLETTKQMWFCDFRETELLQEALNRF